MEAIRCRGLAFAAKSSPGVMAGGMIVLLNGLGAAELLLCVVAELLQTGAGAGVVLPVSDLHIPGYNRSASAGIAPASLALFVVAL